MAGTGLYRLEKAPRQTNGPIVKRHLPMVIFQTPQDHFNLMRAAFNHLPEKISGLAHQVEPAPRGASVGAKVDRPLGQTFNINRTGPSTSEGYFNWYHYRGLRLFKMGSLAKAPPSALIFLHDDSPSEVEGSASQDKGYRTRVKAMPLNGGA
jgi:hypothetical protein